MTTDTTHDIAAFTEAWQAWHHDHETRRADPHGFLAITGLHWLSEEPARFPDAPGAWHTGPDGIVVELDEGESLEVDGATVTGRHAFGVIPERGGVNAGYGDAVIEVARRAGNDIVRPRHPDSPVLAAYTGTSAYAPDPAWAVPARYTPYDAPVDTTVGSVVEGLEHVYGAVGELAFEVEGRTLRLVAFPGYTPDSVSVLFRDRTSGVTTYPAVRSVTVPLPADGAETVVDFNRAVNLPCAYTEHATCPLPPAGNDLPVAVEAGEKTP